MKRRQLKELRAKKIRDLKASLAVVEKELVKLRMEKASGKIKDTTAVRKKRQEIAIIKTLIREKELAREAKR